MVPAHLFAYQGGGGNHKDLMDSIREGLISKAEGESEQYIVL